MRTLRSPLRSACTAAVAALALLTSAVASAQSKEDLDRARAEFQEGVALSAANNCPGALTKFRSVARVKMTPQVAFNIAECEERIGRLAAALGQYRLAASAAEGDAKARDVSNKVGDRITSLEARVPKLTITRGKGAETATIELDGVALGSTQLGAPIPVDPGPHVVVGRIGDKVYARETVNLVEKQNKTFEIVLANVPLEKVHSSSSESAPDKKPVEDSKGRSRVPGIIVTSAGTVSVGVGIVFLVLRGGTISDLDELCNGGSVCPRSAEPIADKGRIYTGVAEVTVGLGAAAVITGIVLIATAGPKSPAKTSLAVGGVEVAGQAPGANVGGASLVGRF